MRRQFASTTANGLVSRATSGYPLKGISASKEIVTLGNFTFRITSLVDQELHPRSNYASFWATARNIDAFNTPSTIKSNQAASKCSSNRGAEPENCLNRIVQSSNGRTSEID